MHIADCIQYKTKPEPVVVPKTITTSSPKPELKPLLPLQPGGSYGGGDSGGAGG